MIDFLLKNSILTITLDVFYRYFSNMKADLKSVVRHHRRLSGLSQSELAKLAGVGKTVVFDIEHGKESVRFDTLKKVLTALNISCVLESPILARTKREPAQSTSLI